jgi:hypothetical protein
MRLYKAHTIKEAIDELLEMLGEYPDGLRTSEMSGTPKFHGGRTLTNRQIAKLLRATHKVDEFMGGHGMRTFMIWKLKATPAVHAEDRHPETKNEIG